MRKAFETLVELVTPLKVPFIFMPTERMGWPKPYPSKGVSTLFTALVRS